MWIGFSFLAFTFCGSGYLMFPTGVLKTTLFSSNALFGDKQLSYNITLFHGEAYLTVSEFVFSTCHCKYSSSCSLLGFKYIFIFIT